MPDKKGFQLAIAAAAVLLVIGVVCYAAYPRGPADTPVRIMFTSAAGKVLFDHKTHAAEEGYGLICDDCHHHFEEDEEYKMSCGACHIRPPADEEAAAEAYDFAACWDCHGFGDVELEDAPYRGDAFHGQCIGCHEDFEAGPVECAGCHVM